MVTRITVVPAYGRDYKSQAEVQAAYDEGKDFIVQDIGSGQNGRATSKRDLEGTDVVLVVRYARLTKAFSPVKGKPDVTPDEDERSATGFAALLDSGASMDELEDYIGDGDILDFL